MAQVSKGSNITLFIIGMSTGILFSLLYVVIYSAPTADKSISAAIVTGAITVALFITKSIIDKNIDNQKEKAGKLADSLSSLINYIDYIITTSYQELASLKAKKAKDKTLEKIADHKSTTIQKQVILAVYDYELHSTVNILVTKAVRLDERLTNAISNSQEEELLNYINDEACKLLNEVLDFATDINKEKED